MYMMGSRPEHTWGWTTQFPIDFSGIYCFCFIKPDFIPFIFFFYFYFISFYHFSQMLELFKFETSWSFSQISESFWLLELFLQIYKKIKINHFIFKFMNAWGSPTGGPRERCRHLIGPRSKLFFLFFFSTFSFFLYFS